MNGNEIQILCINCTDLLPYGYFDVCCAIEYERLGTFFFTLCVFIPVVFFRRIQCPTWRLWVWFIIGETRNTRQQHYLTFGRFTGVDNNYLILIKILSKAFFFLRYYALSHMYRMNIMSMCVNCRIQKFHDKNCCICAIVFRFQFANLGKTKGHKWSTHTHIHTQELCTESVKCKHS